MAQQEQARAWNTNVDTTAGLGFRLDYKSFYDLRKLGCVKSLASACGPHFTALLTEHLPEVAALVDEADFGVSHLEVGALKLATRNAIASRDWQTVQKHFAFVADLRADAGQELRDAIDVSYLGNLFYGELSLNHSKARSLLPKSLAIALEAVERHYEQLVP